jgi:hypothetical protein
MSFSDKVKLQIYDAAGGACTMCYRVRPYENHHVILKGMGGRKGEEKKKINQADNGLLVCHVCHEARHGTRSTDPDGFCCDICACEWACEFSQAKLRHETGLPVIVAKDKGLLTIDELAEEMTKKWN